jgi:excisionase family DNA binding protein
MVNTDVRCWGEAEMLTRKFMTVREVADLTQVSEATVRHWIKDGDLRAIDVGREFRIIPRDLEVFLDRHATRGACAPGAVPDATSQADPAGHMARSSHGAFMMRESLRRQRPEGETERQEAVLLPQLKRRLDDAERQRTA